MLMQESDRSTLLEVNHSPPTANRETYRLLVETTPYPTVPDHSPEQVPPDSLACQSLSESRQTLNSRLDIDNLHSLCRLLCGARVEGKLGNPWPAEAIIKDGGRDSATVS
jgi:hypothetical protein